MEYFQTYDQKIHVMNSCLEEAYRSKGLLLANMVFTLPLPPPLLISLYRHMS
jgi:hypothetical protein